MKKIVAVVLVIGGIVMFINGISIIAKAAKEFGGESPIIALADGMHAKHFLAGMTATFKGMVTMLGGLVAGALGYVLGKI